MNPSVDKIINLKELRVGILNRVESSTVTAGGKGINVANDISAFTNDVALTGFVGDENNEVINDCVFDLSQKGIVTDFVTICGSNRTNIKIIEESGRLTEVNELGFSVKKEDVDILKEKLLKYATPENSFILNGSLPQGVGPDLYSEITKMLKDKGAKVYVDTHGESLKLAIDAKPDLIKPNEAELLELFSEKSVSERSLMKMAKEIISKGVDLVIVSRGEQGAIFVTDDKVVKCEALPVELRSTVGAGDAMVAAYAYASEMGFAFEDCVRYAMAAATYAVTLDTPYFTDSEEVERMARNVNLAYVY